MQKSAANKKPYPYTVNFFFLLSQHYLSNANSALTKPSIKLSLYFKFTPISFFFFNSLIQCSSFLFSATTPLADVNFDSWLFCSWVFIIWALIIFWPPFWAFDFQDWLEEFGSFSFFDVGRIWILFHFWCWTIFQNEEF